MLGTDRNSNRKYRGSQLFWSLALPRARGKKKKLNFIFGFHRLPLKKQNKPKKLMSKWISLKQIDLTS